MKTIARIVTKQCNEPTLGRMGVTEITLKDLAVSRARRAFMDPQTLDLLRFCVICNS